MSVSGQKMNCNEYIEAITADPSESFENGSRHAADCASCAAYRAELRALDEKIAAALEIEVPTIAIPELPPIGDERVVTLPARRKPVFTTSTWIGIAASVALAAVILTQLLPAGGNGAGHQLLVAELLEHLDHEPQALVVTNVSVSDDTLTTALPPSIGTLDRNVGLVSYAKSCVINGKTVPHLVIQGKNGPVTLLLMPHEMINGPVSLDGKSVHGVILPHGDGSIAIIGDREEGLQEIEQRVVDSVEWSI